MVCTGGAAAHLCGDLLKVCPPDSSDTAGSGASEDAEELPETQPGAAEAAAAAVEAATAAAAAAAAADSDAGEGGAQPEAKDPTASDEL